MEGTWAKANVEMELRRRAWREEYKSVIDHLQAKYAEESPSVKKRIQKEDRIFNDFLDGRSPESSPYFLRWVRNVIPGSFQEPTRRAPEYRKVEPLSPGQDPSDFGWLFHGTRGPVTILAEGLCVRPAVEMFDDIEIFGPEDGPYAEMDSWYDLAPSERLEILESDEYQVSAYEWFYLWSFRFYEWYKNLRPLEKKKFLAAIGEKTFDLDDVDVIGEKISLVWVTRTKSTAESYAKNELLLIDCSKANAFGYFTDDVADGENYVLVCPAWCPQVPPEGLRIADV